MAYSTDQLTLIFDRTSGYCHLCHRKLAFKNYGICGERGAWEIEHSNAQALGGTHRLNNLYAAHIGCNRSKGTQRTRTVRVRNGYTKAPLSVRARQEAKEWNAIGGGLIGAVVGSVFGPPGAWIGGVIGAKLAHDQNPDHD